MTLQLFSESLTKNCYEKEFCDDFRVIEAAVTEIINNITLDHMIESMHN